MEAPMMVQACLYGTYGLGFFALLTYTLYLYPLTDWDINSVGWCRMWLYTTVFDYYGAAFCLCGIILHSETRMVGTIWSLGCLLLGTPVCCLWIVSWIFRHGSLKLPNQPYLPVQEK
ncbi:hypothetical protein AAMO2058_000208800 [Amorphochlora amoebiformis]